MKVRIRSLQEFDAYLTGIMNQRMRENVEAMRAHGHTDDDIADAMPTLIEQAEVARIEILDDVAATFFDGEMPTRH